MRLAGWLVGLLVSVGIVRAGEAVGVAQLNESAGLPLFSATGSMWQEDADALAERLGLPVESRTAADASYRLYPAEDARLFGRRPYSIALSAQNGKPVALSIIFANKGDSVGQFARTAPGERPPRPAKVLRDYRRSINEDDESLDAMFESLIGPAEPEKTGTGGRLQEKSRRRDWNGHSFLLVSVRDEYVALRIVSSEDLDEKKRPERMPTKDLRARLATQVERRQQGDVVIRDIPMVDQGPKGFCVPATMERMLRHLGIPSDMYLLAMAANTNPGGGTSVAEVIAAVGQTARRYGRRVITLSGRPDISIIGEWIDAGVPVLWAIKTSNEVDALINQRTRERASVEDWAQWKESLKPARREARKLGRGADERHVCLITGYNKETGEIALSDSWGPGYEERWLTEEEAAAISQGAMAVMAW
jgi:hypothetical protein